MPGEYLSLGDLELEKAPVPDPGCKLFQGRKDHLWWPHKVAIVIAKPGKPTMLSKCSIYGARRILPRLYTISIVRWPSALFACF